MRPGAIEFTVIPSGASSRASVFAQPITPGRTAFDSARPGIGSSTEDAAAAREHRHVRALLRERLRDREAHAGRGAAHDRRAALEAELHAVGSSPARATMRAVIPPRMLKLPSTST